MGEEFTIVRKPVPVPSPTMRDLLAVVFRQRRLATLCFAAIFLAMTLYGVLAPSYQARMKVLVRRGRVDAPVTPAPTASPLLAREEVTEEEVNSQVELLKDEEILRTVAGTAGLAVKQAWYERFLGGNEEVRLERAVRRMTQRKHRGHGGDRGNTGSKAVPPQVHHPTVACLFLITIRAATRDGSHPHRRGAFQCKTRFWLPGEQGSSAPTSFCNGWSAKGPPWSTWTS